MNRNEESSGKFQRFTESSCPLVMIFSYSNSIKSRPGPVSLGCDEDCQCRSSSLVTSSSLNHSACGTGKPEPRPPRP